MKKKSLTIALLSTLVATFAIDATTYMPGFAPTTHGRSPKTGRKKHHKAGGHSPQVAKPRGRSNRHHPTHVTKTSGRRSRKGRGPRTTYYPSASGGWVTQTGGSTFVTPWNPNTPASQYNTPYVNYGGTYAPSPWVQPWRPNRSPVEFNTPWVDYSGTERPSPWIRRRRPYSSPTDYNTPWVDYSGRKTSSPWVSW